MTKLQTRNVGILNERTLFSEPSEKPKSAVLRRRIKALLNSYY